MGNIVATQFDNALFQGLNALANSDTEVELYKDGPTSADTSGANPKQGISFVRSNGSQISYGSSPGSPVPWEQWELASQQSLAEIRVRVNFGVSMNDWLTLDGGDFGSSTADNLGTGTDVTVNPGFLDLGGSDGRAGIATVAINGHQNTTYDAVLLDGTGTERARVQGVSMTYSGQVLSADNDVTFNNSSGGSWPAEEVRIEEQNGGNSYTIDSGVSASVPDGGSITFTTIKTTVDISNP